MGSEKKKTRRGRRSGSKEQARRNKKALYLALQENRENQQQQLIEFTKEPQKIDCQDENVSSLNNSIENNLQCEKDCQSPADSTQSSVKQLDSPQKSEKTVDLLQLLGNNFISVSQQQHWLPVQVKNDGTTEKLDYKSENVSLHDSIEDTLQSIEDSQPSADFTLSLSMKQQNQPQNSEEKVNLLQLLEKNSFLLSQNQNCLPMQAKNEEAEKLDHPSETASTLHNSVENNLQSEENCQQSVDFIESSFLEPNLSQRENEEKVEILQAQETSLSSLCQNTEKVTKTEEDELSSANIELLLLKQEKLFTQYKNRIEKLELQERMVSSFHKYIKLCRKHEDEVFRVKRKLVDYELQIARKKEKLKR